MELDKLIAELRSPTLTGPMSPEALKHVCAMAAVMDRAATALTTMQAREATLIGVIERVRGIVENGYPGQPAKCDKCPHGYYGFEDCIACYDEALLEALATSGS